MKAKFWSISGDSFKIKDMSTSKDGNVLFEVAGKAYSFTNKRTLVDSKTQEPVFVMTEAAMQFDDKQTVYSGDGKTELFKVASNFGNTKQSTSGLKNNQGKKIILEGKMNLLSKKGHICLGDVNTGRPIGKVCSPVQIQNLIPDWSAGGSGWARHDYFIEIAPGVDMALIIAMVLAYEQMEQSYDDEMN
ncbi:unnamed protein product [Polarella glacialis]|uniref:Tubby C-terminal domain-containing protein n=1 Tax=Polarella glacialis TaxID=89957 RepID=A0A813JR54_POLGL|nr:unnamed protein product [Polarella glacialis]CAE8684924.1 unnamed protein product [Polarella glacialis]